MRLFSACVFFLLLSSIGCAQEREQLWLEFQVSYPFANRYLLENTTSYQALLGKEDKWRNISISPTFEYVLYPKLDFLSELPIGYTLQREGTNTFELMPMIGGRFHITQNKRVDTRFVLRYQSRCFYQIEAGDWDISNRLRLRGEIFVCINGPNLFADKLFYGFADYEEFLVVDQQLDERYANRRRARVGIAYRLSYKHRFEFSYARQSARDEIEGDFISNDNVLQLKYKMYLNPPKVSQSNL